MRRYRLIAACLVTPTLWGCQAVVPIAGVNAGIVASEEEHIGDHSIPQNATYIGVGQGHTFLGGVALGDKLALWVIPYNGRYARQMASQGPFVVAIQAWDFRYSGPRTIKLAPNSSYLRLASGEIIRPVGYRAISPVSGAHCHPIGSPTPIERPLNVSAEAEEFVIRNASPCIEVFFDCPVVDPANSFSWVMPSMVEGAREFASRDISFVSHYGR